MPVRAALLTPFALTSATGNSVTVSRIARGLGAREVDVRVWDRATNTDAALEREVDAFAPGIVHAFHAWRVGPLALRIARQREVPLAVTLTGTDANHDLFDPERAVVVRRVLEGAARIVVFDGGIADRVAAALPDLRARIVTIPQSVDLRGAVPFDLRTAWPGLPADRVLFAFVAGLRPVKRPRFPLAALDALVAREPRLRLLYAGPVLDDDEAAALFSELSSRPWARYVGVVPHEAMASLLSEAAVVLNCSLSEGGMANAVLEAQACGRAVLAADIAGNRSLVEHDVTGFLFRDSAEFGALAERLVRDEGLRARLAAAGHARTTERFPLRREIDAYLALYDTVAPVVKR